MSTALLQVAEAMGSARELPETLDVAARLTAALSGLDRCTILLRQPTTAISWSGISYALTGDLLALSCTGRAAFIPIRSPARPIGHHAGADDDPKRCQTSDLIPDDVVQADSVGALVALPLVADDQVVGVLLVDEIEPQRVHNPRLLDILSGIANQAAVAIERARLQHAEIEQPAHRHRTGRGAQHPERLSARPVPQPPAMKSPPCGNRRGEIGGDFYDFIPLADDRLGIVVADVADKGIPAALYMALSRTTMRLVSTRNPSPSPALQRVNTAILDTTYSDMFVTVYYAMLDPASHQITYASGGHGLAFRRAGGSDISAGQGHSPGRLPHHQRGGISTTDLAPGDYLVHLHRWRD